MAKIAIAKGTIVVLIIVAVLVAGGVFGWSYDDVSGSSGTERR